MSVTKEGGNIINSEYSCLTDATTSGPPPPPPPAAPGPGPGPTAVAVAPVLFDEPMYDAAGVGDNQYSCLENAATGRGITNSEYSCLTDATTSGLAGPTAASVLFDEPMYDAAGVGNSATGGDTTYSKLGYNQQAATNTLPMEQTADDQYSCLNTMGRDKVAAAGYGEQEYSSLQHPGVPPAPSDMTDQQQYSVLNK